MSPQEFKDAVRSMRYWQKYVEDEPTTFAKQRKESLEKEIDDYLNATSK